MIEFLVIQIKLGKITIEQIPNKYLNLVLTALEAEKIKGGS